ncbi:D-2-hydroxyacid dehydrogenase [Luteolibacter sp. LG18]|uniref:D-2-hydroxyacid dehydrogenase n=1 Tax=Luteolibacter sp. LG18 TaxID=2819286 RepID=UPI002B2EE6F0|nr:putative NAD-binding protein (D-isomer specific 2-hydroxyacid dehydrogenase?) [Luteolibacter sp. LG18]
MSVLKVFTDIQASPALFDWLRQEIAPHELLIPAKRAASVLVEQASDPLIAEADIAFGQPDVASVLAAPRLKWLQVSSAGFTRYDTPEFRSTATARGLIVTNSSHVYDQACAEHVFAFMLAQARQLPCSLATRCANSDLAWTALRESSRLLLGQSVLIHGYGAIAERLVGMLEPFGVEITAIRRSPRGDEGIRVVTPDRATEALATADHVINILPDNAESRGYFNPAIFSAMKPGSVFYNIGRGTTVDQDALADTLENGPLAAAWLDVTDPEPLPEGHRLLGLPNCHITPHVAGGQSGETQVLIAHFLRNFRRHLGGETLVNRVIG